MLEVNFMSPSLKWQSGILVRVVVPASCVSLDKSLSFMPGTDPRTGAKALHMVGQVAILMNLD